MTTAGSMLQFVRLSEQDSDAVSRMSAMATAIVREHFDPLIGKAQNDYMLSRFQTVEAIAGQLRQGYRYYFVQKAGKDIGFVAFYPKSPAMYLSKFYLYKSERGNGYAHAMMDFVIDAAKVEGLNSIELNVNKYNSACRAYEKLGFSVLRAEKNDIGNGFYMDDYVYSLKL